MTTLPYFLIADAPIPEVIIPHLPRSFFGHRVLEAHVHPTVALLEVHRFSGNGSYFGNGGPYVRLHREHAESSFPDHDLQHAREFYQKFIDPWSFTKPLAVARGPEAEGLLRTLGSSVGIELVLLSDLTARR